MLSFLWRSAAMTVDSKIEIVKSLHAEMRSDLPDDRSSALISNLYFNICTKWLIYHILLIFFVLGLTNKISKKF